MPDFVDANEAKSLLGCDDATLNNYVNNGTIRAQRVDGQLRLLKEDVVNLAGTSASDSDDGTIILSGDSEDLSIDLGEVVDDSAVTMVQTRSDEQSDSITFGDELEVVSFDETHTEELSFEDSDATQSLTFTDSNTAIGTDVDETVIGTATATATATSDFQTVDYGDDDPGATTAGGGTMRRSVRSQRVRYEKPKTHWIWPTLLVLNILIACLWVVPYFFLIMWPQDGTYHQVPLFTNRLDDTYFLDGSQRRGYIDPNIWTQMADGVAGFSTEPDRVRYQAIYPEGEWRSIDNPEVERDTPDQWRYREWRGPDEKDPDQRPGAFIIRGLNYREDGAVEGADKVIESAYSVDASGNPKTTFTVVERPIEGTTGGTEAKTVRLPQYKLK